MSSSAIAADLPRKAPVVAPAPLPMATWSGCYLSGGVGYGMWNQDNQSFDSTASDFVHTDGGRGWLGRVGGGCDYQIAQRWVVGVLADYDFSSLKGDMTLPGSGLQGEEKSNWTWAAGGRVGYLPWENLLVFVSAGYTQANFRQINLTTGAGVFEAFIPETKYSGWFLGSGYEYRFDWLPGLYWKTEYRFSDLGSKTNLLFDTAGVPDGRFVDTSHKFIQTVTSSLCGDSTGGDLTIGLRRSNTGLGSAGALCFAFLRDRQPAQICPANPVRVEPRFKLTPFADLHAS